MAAIWSCDPAHLNDFSFLKTLEAVLKKFGYNRPVVSEENSFEIVDGWPTDGRQTDDGACLYLKLPRSLRHRWLKRS